MADNKSEYGAADTSCRRRKIRDQLFRPQAWITKDQAEVLIKGIGNDWEKVNAAADELK